MLTLSMSYHEFPVSLREPHLRLNEYIRIRPWIFNFILGDVTADIKILQLGDLLMIGMPCDFSGELVSEINHRGHSIIITSFNGKYVGYITKDEIYNKKVHEVEQMNWFGPYNGSYFTEIANELIKKY